MAACNLGGLDLDSAMPPPDLGERLLVFARQCGFTTSRAARAAVSDLLDCGAAFTAKVRDSGASEDTKRQLLHATASTRKTIERALLL